MIRNDRTVLECICDCPPSAEHPGDLPRGALGIAGGGASRDQHIDGRRPAPLVYLRALADHRVLHALRRLLRRDYGGIDHVDPLRHPRRTLGDPHHDRRVCPGQTGPGRLCTLALHHLFDRRWDLQRSGHDGGDPHHGEFRPALRTSGILFPRHPRVERRFEPLGRFRHEGVSRLLLRDLPGDGRNGRYHGRGAIHVRDGGSPGGDQFRNGHGGAARRVRGSGGGRRALPGVQERRRLQGTAGRASQTERLYEALVPPASFGGHRNGRRIAAGRRGDDRLLPCLWRCFPVDETPGEDRPRLRRGTDGRRDGEQRRDRGVDDHPPCARSSREATRRRC